MPAILGLSAFYHDSAAALIVDGKPVAAAQEERFTRRKHDPEFPTHAVEYCLREAGLTTQDLDYVAFYEKPLRKFERLIETYLGAVPGGYRSFRQAVPAWLGGKLHLRRTIRQRLGSEFRGRLVFPSHHESHAASAFFPSPFDEAAILTVDGVGEWSTTTRGVGRGNQITLTDELRFPHSLGLLYSAFTYYCGFRVNSGEYKLMGLAPYGEPRYADLIREKLLDLKPDGTFRLRQEYFNYRAGLTMTSRQFDRLFGGPPRTPEADLTQREMDLAASVQLVTEEVLLSLASGLAESTGLPNLVMAGGVALNCVANGRILRETPFERLWIQPAAGDAGGALGAAWLLWHQLLGREREPKTPDHQSGSLLGPMFSDEEIRAVLDADNATYTVCDSDEELCSTVARLIDEGNVVGWFQGRMEFGPRALGSRSILGDARSRSMQSTMNLKIKFRESFRPFAPIVLAEHAPEWFDIDAAHDSPYMLIVTDVRESKRTQLSSDDAAKTGLDRRRVCRSELPAITHVDNSARLQTVDAVRSPLLHQLLSTFHERTGCPVMINTSFNVRSEPIVCTPADAYRCFRMTEMDVLAVGRQIVLRSEQPTQISEGEREQHLTGFALD